ncbi:hypothetical protein BC833DRAFT_588488 [Globomyces pollinis-pini]|nr:hypothetical protein BC833DRAFT_588488 [Globomyces pollinis-pini]
MGDKEEFMRITGANADHATYFLEASKGDLQTAISTFYESQQPAKDDRKIKTFQELQAEDEDLSDDDPDQKLYAGGEKSGIAVKGPPKESTAEGLVKDILGQAAKGGVHEEVAKKPKTFSGSGFRLGSEQGPSTVSTPAEPPVRELETVSRLLTFWKNGFSIEDGPLLRYDDPKNQEFLTAIKSGRAPTSLIKAELNQPVEVKVAQRMEEDYQPPPKAPMKSFQGSGNRLGSIAGPSASSSAMPGGFPAASNTRAETSTVTPSSISVNNDLPITSIQVRLGDGTRLIGRFNHVHTVLDLRRFVQASRPDSRSFVLQTAMPTKVISDDTLSLKDAGLLNSVVIQRYV